MNNVTKYLKAPVPVLFLLTLCLFTALLSTTKSAAQIPRDEKKNQEMLLDLDVVKKPRYLQISDQHYLYQHLLLVS
jgi:hypothetical protein